MPQHYESPVARNTDPETSHLAAESAAKGADLQRARVRRIMERHASWMTHPEVYLAYLRTANVRDWPDAAESGIRTRVRELYDEGAVERDNPATVRNENGRLVHQWRYVSDPERREDLAAARQMERDQADIAKLVEEHRPPKVEYVQGPTLAIGNYHVVTTPDQVDQLPIDTVLMTISAYPDVLRQDYLGQWRSLNDGKLIPSEDVLEDARILFIPPEARSPELDATLGNYPLEDNQ